MWPVLVLLFSSSLECCATFPFPMPAKLKLLLPTCFFFSRADHIDRMKRENIKKIKISEILESKNCIYCHIRNALMCSIVEYMGFCYEMAHSRKFFNCLHFQWNTRREGKKCFCILYILLLLLAAEAQLTIGKCLGREKNSFIDSCYHMNNRK